MIQTIKTDNGYCVEAAVTLQNGPQPASVRFQISNGAVSKLHPRDLPQFKLPDDFLNDTRVVTIGRLGGSSRYHVVKAVIAIVGTKPGARERIWKYAIDLHVAVPAEYNAELPSVIGQDITRNWAWSRLPDADIFRITPRA